MRRLLPLSVLLLLCSACGTSAPGSSEPGSSASLDYSSHGSARAVFDEKTMQITLPLSTYIKSPLEGAITLDANIMTNNDCIQKAGQPSLHHQGPIPVKPAFDFGIWGRSFVATHGYASGDDQNVRGIDVATSLPEGKDTDQQMEVYNQCVAMHPQLSDFPSGQPEKGTDARSAYDESLAAWRADEDVKKWHEDWKKCLNDDGIKVSDEEYWSPTVSGGKEEEITTALKDLDCKDSTGYFTRSMNRLAAYQAAAIAPRKARLDEYRKHMDQDIEKAKSILSAHGEPVPRW